MNRRSFIQAVLSSLCIPPTLAFAHASAAASEWHPADRFFYDDRFPLARRLAAELSGAAGLTPVRGDVTNIWNSVLKRERGKESLNLQGVTTESFHFCLGIMAAERYEAKKWATRIDQDLFLWQIRCGQAINLGVRA